MKKRFAVPFLMIMFLSIGAIQVHAETETIKTESVTLTEDDRYQEEYYGQPMPRYAQGKGTRSLARDGQTLEEYIVAALENFETEIDVSAYNVPKETAAAEYFKILNNNPQLFYVKSTYNGLFYQGQATIFSYKVTYIYDKETALQMREELEAAVDEAASQVDRSLEDYQQALIVHDYLAQNCEYDKERLDANNVPDISHTAYGSLVNKIAVCDGYADAFAYIMKDRLGIACEVISSDAMAHAWNMIEIGGKWYHVDATWDDPTWDCIGRVMHNYFLLSDSKISDSEHKHKSWSDGHTADSAFYDEAFWSGVSSAICYANDSWYYSKYQLDNDDLQKKRAVKLVKKEGTQLLADSEDVVYATSVWSLGSSCYPMSFMYLAKAGDKIYFNTSTEIFCLNADGSVDKFYSPQDLAGGLIDGFTARGGEFYYSSKSDFMTSKKQDNIRKIDIPSLAGISAEDVTGTYTGRPYLIEVTGVQDGDVIKYAGADGKYQAVQPEMVDAGIYEVRYQVERAGYMSFQGKATVTIEQAAPTYELPKGLAGNSGDKLADVQLPTGFTWQEPDTKLREEGSHSYPAIYTPEDTKNYQTVNVSIAVTVTCPGHRYVSEVTKEPTGTEKGIMTYTCTLCGDSYTEEIDEMPSEITGITAEDVTGPYNGQAYKIVIAGLEDGDIVLYALKSDGDAVFEEEQPEMINVGTYEVLYKVARAGHVPFQGKATVTIGQAAPTYELPEGLAGNSGNKLADVQLPAGFTWKEPDTQLREEGSYSYPAIYTPEDTKNYQTVNVSIAVTVTCPGHRYVSEVTKEPTGTEKGIMTYTCTLCGDSYTEEIDEIPPEITGITAEAVAGTYNGQAYKIVIAGLEDEDIVQYALKSDGAAVFAEEQPEMINAGIYEVLYKVSRTGYRTFEGSVLVEIARAKPQYSVPTGLKGSSGTNLGAIKLPEGFVWQTDPKTVLSKTGNQTFYVCYIPMDQVNYQSIMDIKVTVEVICSNHQYQAVISRKPTETQKGLMTYTCKLCGKTFTEEIPMLSPSRPGSVVGLQIAKRTTNSLSYSWQNVSGVNYRLALYKGSELVYAINVTGNSYTYGNLKPATAYTLQVTPYRIVNGKNVYAAAADSVRTATSPAKAKLSKAKRSGGSKVKLTWKRVSGASGYEIFMKTGNGKFKRIKTIGKGQTVSFTKTKLSKKKSYSFKMRAYVTVDGKKIYGADSNVKKVK